MRYQTTHPWISFSINLLNPNSELWMLLGEAKSKCVHLANEILEPKTAQELYKVYLAKGALATNAIEGNTLSEAEALQQVERTLKLPPSQEYLGQEIDNIVTVCDDIAAKIAQGKPPLLNIETIEGFNAQVLHNLKLESRVVPGKIRLHGVGIANRYEAPPFDECEHLLRRLCDWLNGEQFRLSNPQMTLPFGIIKAVLAHLYIAWIHPFGDGNGRTARLVEFLLLIESGVPDPAAHLLSNHYNVTRTEYYRQLQEATKPGGDFEFLTYGVRGFVDGLHSQLLHIRDQQWNLAWRSYVHNLLPEGSAINNRRRHLVLDLSEQPEPVPWQKAGEITPRVAKDYVRKSPKTLVRDLRNLINMKLITYIRGPGKVRANKEIVLGMRPLVAKLEEPKSASDGKEKAKVVAG